MNQTLFYLALIIPFSLLGLYMGNTISFDAGVEIFQYLIVFYIPVLTFVIMKYIGMRYKEMLLAFVPFYGLKYRYKVFTEK